MLIIKCRSNLAIQMGLKVVGIEVTSSSLEDQLLMIDVLCDTKVATIYDAYGILKCGRKSMPLCHRYISQVGAFARDLVHLRRQVGM